MKKIVGMVGLLAIIGCKEKDTAFLISNDKVGKLDQISLVRDLDLIYADDSIVKDTFSTRLDGANRKVKVFEKGGKHLLTLTPTDDSIPKIENVQIMDPRFTTEDGIGLNSTFKDIQDRYTIKKIVTALNNIVIFVNETNLYFTIDKEQLPENLRYSKGNVEAVQIPDDAKIKFLMLGWD
ncbi:hypothetical protein [Croceivirga radicis]|uniref:Uncharacterized protein n=2 Tax=Croceivirga radicis TaxID=1929488 RepID=A0A1V6LPQ1_9FLAO|nr:hypothetical protein [Croceivirga radicis]OQD42175.1 hypothetical protein BUL40_12215 [Croceivirga radicis]